MELGYIKIENDIVIDACDNALDYSIKSYMALEEAKAERLMKMSRWSLILHHNIWKRPETLLDAICIVQVDNHLDYVVINHVYRRDMLINIKWLVKMSIKAGSKYVYLSSKSVDYIKNYIGKTDYNEL